MRQNLLHPRSRLSITQWLERSALSFSSRPVSVNQTASYSSRRRAGLRTPKDFHTFEKSEFFGNHLLVDGERDENRVVSPLSFHLVLSFLAASSGGSTRRQLLSFFKVDSVDRLNSFASKIFDTIVADGDPDVGPRIRCSNGLWLDQSLTLKPSFKRILDSDYRAALNPVDFQTKGPHVSQQINSWVKNETSGLVEDLIRELSLDNSVKLVFTNSLYFKGAWDEEARLPFVSFEDVLNENYFTAPLMTAKRKEFGRWYDGFKMLHQPYKKQSEDKRLFRHEFTYPRVNTEHGFETYVTETLMDVRGSKTPKFNISSEVEASHVLRQLGVTWPFSGAELTDMLSCLDGGELYVFSIFQKAFMEINEQGTEAATATAAIVMTGRPPDLLPASEITIPAAFPFLFDVGIDEYGSVHMAKTQLVVAHMVNGG